VAEGVVEVLGNGSAFLRVNPPDPSDEDIYISAAQVKRCELVSGDRIAGPRRAPRRSERFASLVRVDTINGRPASEVADSARFDELPAGFAVERFRLGSEDPTLKAIEFLTPFGRGSRVIIAGPAQAGKTHALRLVAGALSLATDVELLVALVGVRPEELPEWGQNGTAPAAAVSAAMSPDAQAQAVERVLDQARRLVARGNHVAVLIDTLSGLPPTTARRTMASARRIVDGGSLTVIATAPEPVGGETTVITLDPALTAAGRWPAVDLAASWTMRAELLVGEGGAEVIVRARAEALEC
jgi:transcription termination factor Rho